jgi:hypothetical protein
VGIQIDEEGFISRFGEFIGKINGGGSFTAASLAVVY